MILFKNLLQTRDKIEQVLLEPMFNSRKSDIQAKGRKTNRQTKTLIIFLDKDVT